VKLSASKHHKVLIYSDTHYGHDNIISHCSRPYVTIDEMDAALISLHNENVKKNDIVIHLGDFAFKISTEERIKIFNQLNGQFIFLHGNHDSVNFKAFLKTSKKVLFSGDYLEISYSFDKLSPRLSIALSHRPFESWDSPRQIHIHGHTHGDSRRLMNRVDAGIDATKIYYPIPIDHLLTINNIFPFLK